MKKIYSFIIIVLCLITIVSVFPTTTSATTVNTAYVQNKINSLSKLFPTGSYFTTTGTNSCNTNVIYKDGYSYCYSKSCPTCKLENVLIYNSKAKNTIVPAVYTSGSRYSCCGFAAFAFCYIFEHDPSVNTTTISSGTSGITEAFLSKLKVGDYIKCYTSTSASTPAHYNIFLGYDNNYVYFYESNYDSPNQVEYYHKRPRTGTSIDSKWVKLVAYRSNTYEKSNTTVVNDIWLLSPPDGVLSMRIGATTSATKICDIPGGNYITVTQYDNDGKWDWGYTTYNGQSGWVCLYYATKHTSHSYGSWQTVTAATCTTAGSQKRTCACGAVENGTIAALGHNYSSTYTVDKAATCTVVGSKSKHCTRCSATTEVTPIPATGHSYGEWQINRQPTCTEIGQKVRFCSVCTDPGMRIDFTDIPALGHNYASTYTIDKIATCTTAGTKSHHCTRSGCTAKADVTTVVATGHSYGSWQTVTGATCTAAGSQKRSCSTCGNTEYKTIPALGHNYSSSWTVDKAATCTTAGTKSHHCTRSGCSAKTDVTTVSATGHSWSGWMVTKESTYDSTGAKVRKCTVSGCSAQETAVIAKLSLDGHTHNFGEWVIESAATCTKNGLQKRSCSICRSYETQEITALGHSVGEWTVEKIASCIGEGKETRSCVNCHESEIHITPALGHSFGEWQTKTEATAEKEGLLERKCSNCSATETQTTPKLNGSSNTSGDSNSSSNSGSPLPDTDGKNASSTPKENSTTTTVIIVCAAVLAALLSTLIVLVIKKKK